MSNDFVAVLCFLEDRMQPMRAADIAEDFGMPVERVYAALVRLYDMGLARISRAERTGIINGWEAA
jgi:DNA-binding IclR family transcriptional regulator